MDVYFNEGGLLMNARAGVFN